MEVQNTPRPTPMPLVWAMVVIMIVIELAFQLGDAGYLPDLRRPAYLYGAFWRTILFDLPPAFTGQQATMFISHAFLHGGVIHVAMNMVVFLSIGKIVVELAGQFKMLILFSVSATGGGVGFALLGPDELVPMVGASGAVFGFLAAWKVWEFNALRAMGRDITPIFKFIGGMVLVNVALHFAYSGMIAWEAHLGGAIAGGAIAPFLPRRRKAL